MHILKDELFIKKPLKEVFAFFNTPKNLAIITPPFMNFTLLTPEPITMKEGAVFDYSIRIFGAPVRWQSLISDYHPPYSFTDIQLRGPHDYWHHQHIFTQKDDGVLISDIVLMRLPLGILGSLGYHLVAKHLNRAMFSHRKKIVRDIFS
ncbi:MAG: SRPBCC family protein [bacterium]